MSVTVTTQFKRPSKKTIEEFRRLLEEYHSIASAVSDNMNRLNTMSSDIKPLFEGIRVVGVALTVRTIASDIDPLIKALDYIQSGDIIAVDTHNSKDTAFWGELVCIEAQRKGAIGIIMDCAVRDVVELKELGFPTLCQGITTKGAGKIGLGYVNVPVQCGGAAVNPGDIFIVDDNGVVVVPEAEGENILQKTKRFLENEARIIERVKAGERMSKILGLEKLEKPVIDTTAIYEQQRESSST